MTVAIICSVARMNSMLTSFSVKVPLSVCWSLVWGFLFKVVNFRPLPCFRLPFRFCVAACVTHWFHQIILSVETELNSLPAKAKDTFPEFLGSLHKISGVFHIRCSHDFWSPASSSGAPSTGQTCTCWRRCRGGHKKGQRAGAPLLWGKAESWGFSAWRRDGCKETLLWPSCT